MGSYMPGSQILIGPIKLSQLITGSLVNLTLVVAAAFTGLGSGITVGVVSSVLATLIGVNLPLPQMNRIVKIAAHKWFMPPQRLKKIIRDSASFQGAMHVYGKHCEKCHGDCDCCIVGNASMEEGQK